MSLLPLAAFLKTWFGTCNAISFIDSLSLAVCHNRRINSHKVFKAMARRGKNSVGWFYGFKVDLVINDQGDILAVTITPGNVDDRAPYRGSVGNWPANSSVIVADGRQFG